ncbi:MAG TPA: SIS domain-containing protein [Terriglobales bacterium]|nr:SIS domain-containing protein [Terriglobales bacterium]
MAAVGNGARQDRERHQVQSSEIYFRRLASLIPQLPFRTIDAMASVLLRALEEGRTVFVFGNGGSAASASHAVCDLNKGVAFHDHPRRLKVISLTDNVPMMTAWANDLGYKHIFSQQLRSYLQPHDVALAVSCSGDSPNVLLGLETARAMGGTTLGIAGNHGGSMKALCDICAVVPSDDVRMIEDMHHAVLHALSAAVAEHAQASAPRMAVAAGSNDR